MDKMPQQKPAENYVNVEIDLIDLSDGSKTTDVKTPSVKNDRVDVRKPKLPVSRHVSSPDHAIKSNVDDSHSDYVVMPPRGKQNVQSFATYFASY